MIGNSCQPWESPHLQTHFRWVCASRQASLEATPSPIPPAKPFSTQSSRRYSPYLLKFRQLSLGSIPHISLQLPGCCLEQPESLYPLEDGSEQLLRYRDLGHLEDDVSRMTDDLRADLDQLLSQGCHRPVAHGLWQSSLTEEVPKVVRKDKELQTDMIVAEVMTGKPRPIHRILAFLDALFRCPSVVVEMDNVLLAPSEVGDNEPDSGEELATMPFYFCDYPTLMIPHCGLVMELVVQDYRCFRRKPDRSRHKMLDFTV